MVSQDDQDNTAILKRSSQTERGRHEDMVDKEGTLLTNVIGKTGTRIGERMSRNSLQTLLLRRFWTGGPTQKKI